MEIVLSVEPDAGTISYTEFGQRRVCGCPTNICYSSEFLLIDRNRIVPFVLFESRIYRSQLFDIFFLLALYESIVEVMFLCSLKMFASGHTRVGFENLLWDLRVQNHVIEH